MARSPWVRVLSVLLVGSLAFVGVVLTVPNDAQAATQTWDSDGDFNLGTYTGTEVLGSGPGAYVQLVQDATDWRNHAPASNPGAREGVALAYDSTNNVVVAFGGYDGAYHGDTWEYDPSANTWTQTSSTGPSARELAGMAFDSSVSRIVLFGGLSATDLENDTWEYNAATNSWQQICATDSCAPPRFASYSLAYHSAASRTIIASQGLDTNLMQTWAYNAATDTWQNRGATFAPVRASHGLAYHAGLNRVVLFGGSFFVTVYGDTWEYDYTANSWTLRVPDGNGPPARTSMGMGYRYSDSAVWMFGGSSGTPFSDTWRYFDVSGTRVWTNVPTQRSPSARELFSMTDEAANERSYIYGGAQAGGFRASDTWSIGPAFRGVGNWESPTFDSLGANADWNTLSWIGTTPAGTILRFQTASADEPNPPSGWTFIGGAACNSAGYYTTSGATICTNHDNHRYLRVRAYLLTTDNNFSPSMDTVTLDYTVPPSAPFLVTTLPNFPPNAPLNTPIFIRFSEPMNIGTVQYTISPLLSVSESWSEADSALTLSHAGLQECKAYTVTVTAGEDLAGNPLNNGLNRDNNPFSFVSVCIYPVIDATNPAQGAADIPLNAPIVVDFSEPMDIATVNVSIAPAITLSRTWSNGDRTLTLTHATDFEQCTNYAVTIDGRDLAGLQLIPGPVPNPWDFTSVCTIPFIVTTNPAHQQTGVPGTASVVVNFSEPMQRPTVTYTSSPVTAFTQTWSNGDRTLTLSHAVAWADCTMVTMEITAGKDLDGNDLWPGKHNGHADNPWKFAVTCPSPFIIFTLPQDGDTGVDQFGNISIQFSEAMNTGSVTVELSPPLAVTLTWMGLDQLLVVSHTLPFACGVNWVWVNGSDPDGNPLVPGLAAEPFSFTPSCPNPFIVRTNPAADETNVALVQPIEITFSEAMNRASVVWAVNPIPLGGFAEVWTNGDTVLTLNHATPFDQNTQYIVAVLDGQDLDGNTITGGPAPNPWRFTTAGINPQILSTNPVDGETNVPVGANVVVVFSEPMDRATVVATPNPAIFLSYGWDPTNTTLTLSHIQPFLDCTRYMFTVVGDDMAGDSLIPGPAPNPWNFTTQCFRPVITDTNPANGAVDVPLDAPIWVNFSKAMNTVTTGAVANPAVTFTETWFNGDTLMRLTHGTFFTDCTLYTITVTGQDTSGNPLDAGPVPNPWTFRTVCPAPQITNTVPADGDQNVPTTGPIVVTFSRAMNRTSVSWTFTPGATAGSGWTVGDTVLTLTPSPMLLECTNYQVLIQGKSVEDKDLVAGPVPNPWSFSTVCPVLPPGGLTVTRAPPTTVRLAWNAVPSADGYRIYESQNRFTPFASWNLLGTVPATTYDALGHLNDGMTHYYVVRAVRGAAESAPSTMGVKIEMTVAFNAGGTNVRWFSLPYRSEYTTASQIANELGPGKVSVLGKWNPATQRTLLYYYFRGAWRGTDFAIGSGDGLYLSATSGFTWSIVGTDRTLTLSFTLNSPPLTNINWVGVPYTGTYTRASDIVRDIEGGTGPGTNTKIIEVAKWDAATQTLVTYFYTGAGWAGNDFTINPGDGIYMKIVASFSWQPDLVTPEVP